MWGLAAHAVYASNLATFPFIPLVSAKTVASVVGLGLDHWMWFRYFSSTWYPFSFVISYFGLCIWLVPFLFFISSSANDTALPMPGASAAMGGIDHGAGRGSGVAAGAAGLAAASKSWITTILDAINEAIHSMTSGGPSRARSAHFD
ncbi:uncharacterized protein AMSG_04183 [Thecamonas trahens ATCC 50062]|uniref:Uncharacterized protein n=1 Tax=Thecamonas trahens ATCC 50062 TaxID=461836 RepID=A0A0L0D6H0_THETB|nr:hypothetical protein AMSG_04183 [Thecamonas trahens ATCC 50062]KNC47949.1 hypothetical protein AMSG_04183 [Thecamonas trahens ATCC 50062]|eukprot:XP_013758966.1 hypothetical protein AMSG_04183 [Thecamonas trahens ATCC 50062]